MKQKYQHQLKDLTNQIDTLTKEKEKRLTKIEQELGMPENFWDTFDWKNMYSDERACAYFGTSEPIEAEYDKQTKILSAKYAALFMIANNIAQRGKLLHPDTAIHKLQKHGDDGKFVINTIENNFEYQPILNAHAYLSRELYRSYHITLMDYNLYNYCQEMIKMYKNCGRYGEKGRKHYENFAKKFHKKYIDKIRFLRQNLDQKPF